MKFGKLPSPPSGPYTPSSSLKSSSYLFLFSSYSAKLSCQHGCVQTFDLCPVHDIVVVDVVEVVVLFDDVVMDDYEIVVFAGVRMLAGYEAVEE
ncbi:hypothetical protein Tco_0733166 [Tanacetum coccineum]